MVKENPSHTHLLRKLQILTKIFSGFGDIWRHEIFWPDFFLILLGNDKHRSLALSIHIFEYNTGKKITIMKIKNESRFINGLHVKTDFKSSLKLNKNVGKSHLLIRRLWNGSIFEQIIIALILIMPVYELTNLKYFHIFKFSAHS